MIVILFYVLAITAEWCAGVGLCVGRERSVPFSASESGRKIERVDDCKTNMAIGRN